MTTTASQAPLRRGGEELRDMDPRSRPDIAWPDERLFTEQLERLDRQLAAWSGAIREAHHALSEMASALPVESASLETPGAADRASEYPLTSSVAAEAWSAPPKAEQQGAAFEPAAGDERVSAATHGEPEEPAGTRAEYTAQPADPGADADAAAQPLSPEEEADRALLDSLDRETAFWIRVHRRISPQPRSVRELLDEFEATRRKSRWWSGRR